VVIQLQVFYVMRKGSGKKSTLLKHFDATTSRARLRTRCQRRITTASARTDFLIPPSASSPATLATQHRTYGRLCAALTGYGRAVA
jgi:hypothetical protein